MPPACGRQVCMSSRRAYAIKEQKSDLCICKVPDHRNHNRLALQVPSQGRYPVSSAVALQVPQYNSLSQGIPDPTEPLSYSSEPTPIAKNASSHPFESYSLDADQSLASWQNILDQPQLQRSHQTRTVESPNYKKVLGYISCGSTFYYKYDRTN